MRFVVRIVIGAVLGILALAVMAIFGVRWWIVALTSGLLAPLAFLGTFFLWSADRPDLGYEQVLFDAPNTTFSIIMLVVLAGASFGFTHIHFGGSAAAAIAPTEAAQVALIHIASDAQKQKGAADKGDVKTINAFLLTARAQVAALANVTKTDPALQTATDNLSTGLNELGNCAASPQSDACVSAQVDLGGVLRELTKYVPGAAKAAANVTA